MPIPMTGLSGADADFGRIIGDSTFCSASLVNNGLVDAEGVFARANERLSGSDIAVIDPTAKRQEWNQSFTWQIDSHPVVLRRSSNKFAESIEVYEPLGTHMVRLRFNRSLTTDNYWVESYYGSEGKFNVVPFKDRVNKDPIELGWNFGHFAGVLGLDVFCTHVYR